MPESALIALNRSTSSTVRLKAKESLIDGGTVRVRPAHGAGAADPDAGGRPDLSRPADRSSAHRRGCLRAPRPGVVAAPCALFEQVWQSASPVGRPPRTDRDPERTGARPALAVDAGDTDEQADRKPGVSTRTVGGWRPTLMTRLGARSRFHAGSLAAPRGWLAPE
jgi:hypothetical protein